MRRVAMLVGLLLGALCAGAWGELTPEQTKQAEGLVKQLGDADFKTRDAATKKLVEMGVDVLPVIKKAMEETKDQEIKARCELVPQAMAQELLKKMDLRGRADKSRESDVLIVDLGPENTHKMTIHWAREQTEKDGKIINKGFWTQKRTVTTKEGKTIFEGEQKIVMDGEFSWKEERDLTAKTVKLRKSLSNDVEAATPDNLNWFLSSVRAYVIYGIRVTGEEVIEGQKMYVLEVSRKYEATDDEDYTECRSKFWIGEKDLLPRKWTTTYVCVTKDKSTTETVEFMNWKVNQKVDPELFKYTPPAGVEVEDHTKK